MSRAAASILEQDWDCCLPTHLGSTNASAFAWKSQGKELARLLTLYVSNDAEPLELLRGLCEDVMPNLGNQHTMSDAFPCAPSALGR